MRVRLVVSVTALMAGAVACGSTDPPRPNPRRPARGSRTLTRRDVQAAADLTSDPAAASAAIGQMFDGLDPTDVRFGDGHRQRHRHVHTLDADWTFRTPAAPTSSTALPSTSAPAPAENWEYTTAGGGPSVADGGVIEWNPALLAPGLTPDTTLRYTTLAGGSPKVLADNGSPLMTEQTVTLVTLDPAVPSSAAAVAPLIAPLAPGVTAATLESELAAAQGRPLTAITLRESDAAPLRAQLAATPVSASSSRPDCSPSTALSLRSPTLDGLRQLWEQGQADTAGLGRATPPLRRPGGPSRRPRRHHRTRRRDHTGPGRAGRRAGCDRGPAAAVRDRRDSAVDGRHPRGRAERPGRRAGARSRSPDSTRPDRRSRLSLLRLRCNRVRSQRTP